MPKEQRSLQQLVDSGVIKELKPELAKKAIEGYEDVLTPAARVQEAVYRQHTCPHCGGDTLSKEYLGGPQGKGTTWLNEEPLPNAMLRCTDCGTLFNPGTGMIVETASPIEVPEPAPVPGLKR